MATDFKCGADVVSVIREEEQNANNFINRKLSDEGKNKMILSAIPEGRRIYPHENVDRVEVRGSMPQVVAYKTPDLSQKGYKDVEVKGRSNCSTSNESQVVLGNEVDDDACEDACKVKIHQGFKEFNHFNYLLNPETDVYCVDKLWELPADRVREYWDNILDLFSDWLVHNKEQNFMKYAIDFGGANSSAVDGVIGSSKLFTEGRFVAEPTYGLSVGHILSYRDRMIATGGLGRGEYITIYAPKRDIIAAVKHHTETSAGANYQVNIDFTDSLGEGFLRGKKEFTYETIRFVVDEMPCKGFFKGGKFTPVYPWKSGAEGFVGLADDWNDQYYSSCVYCEGKKYPMVNLAFFINPKAMTHHPFHPPINPVASRSEYANFMRIISGNETSLGCNDDNNKFKLRANVAGRFAFGDTQWMGAIAYLAETSCGVMRKPCGTCDEDTVCENPVGSPEYDQCAQGTDCPTCEDETANLPCEIKLEEESVETAYVGTDGELTLRVKGLCGGAGTFDYTLTAGTASAGSEYTDVSGTATIEEGCTDDFLIVIPITGAIDPTSDFTVTLSNPTGDLALGTCVTTTVTIVDASANCPAPDCDAPVAP